MAMQLCQVLPSPVERFIDQILCNVGQPIPQASPITGLLFLPRIFIADCVSGLRIVRTSRGSGRYGNGWLFDAFQDDLALSGRTDCAYLQEDSFLDCRHSLQRL